MVEVQSLKVKYKEPLLMFENVNGTFKNVSSVSVLLSLKTILRAVYPLVITITTETWTC